MDKFSILSKSLSDTFNIASILAPLLNLGDIVILEGGLAAGKTYFVKAFAQALDSADTVTSPTYGIANFYTIRTGSLLHVDVYRLSGISEFRGLGLDEYFDEAITFIEWGDKVKDDFADYLFIQIHLGEENETHRTMKFSYHGDRWKPDFTKFKQSLFNFIE